MEQWKRTSRGQRAGRGWTPVSRGVHRRVDADPITADLIAWQQVLPTSARFTHLTAARVYGWWMPPVPPALPVHVVIDRRQTRPSRPGLRVIRHTEVVPARLLEGVRLDPPADTLLACARDLCELDLVVLVDSALHAGDVTLEQLGVMASGRRRGGPALRLALEGCDARAESAWEVLLRRLHLSCGIEVVPQHEVHDESGVFLARGDLWLVGTRMLHEYDGGHHLAKSAQRNDLRRARSLGNSAWSRRGYTDREVLHQPLTILRDADLTLGRPHDPTRIRAWTTLLRESAFTPAGTARLCRRLGLTEMGDLVS
jgi:hypothetical protein